MAFFKLLSVAFIKNGTVSLVSLIMIIIMNDTSETAPEKHVIALLYKNIFTAQYNASLSKGRTLRSENPA